MATLFLNDPSISNTQESLHKIPWQVTLAQISFETGWNLESIPGSNNPFGITYPRKPGTGSYIVVWTKEEGTVAEWKDLHEKWGNDKFGVGNCPPIRVISNRLVEILRAFRKFDSLTDAFNYRSNFLTNGANSTYEAAKMYQDDPYRYLYTIAPVYATDSEYYSGVAGVIDQYFIWNGKPESIPIYM